jgi:hypothetical protein
LRVIVGRRPGARCEWHFERDGWHFAAGVHARRHLAAAVDRGRAVLATWQWHDRPAAGPAEPDDRAWIQRRGERALREAVRRGYVPDDVVG